MDERNMPIGHKEAMNDLLSQMIDNDSDFETWHQKFKIKEKEKIVQEQKYFETLSQEKLLQEQKNEKIVYEECRRLKDQFLKKCSDGFKNPTMIFSPPLQLEAEFKKRGLKFTVGKEYPIYAEVSETHLFGMRCITIDDEGNRRSVNSAHFNLPTKLQYQITEGICCHTSGSSFASQPDITIGKNINC